MYHISYHILAHLIIIIMLYIHPYPRTSRSCDENSWDLVGGKYPLSNACGQLGQSYQHYHCSPEEAHMECPVDPNMSITGVTHAKWYV